MQRSASQAGRAVLSHRHHLQQLAHAGFPSQGARHHEKLVINHGHTASHRVAAGREGSRRGWGCKNRGQGVGVGGVGGQVAGRGSRWAGGEGGGGDMTRRMDEAASADHIALHVAVG